MLTTLPVAEQEATFYKSIQQIDYNFRLRNAGQPPTATWSTT